MAQRAIEGFSAVGQTLTIGPGITIRGGQGIIGDGFTWRRGISVINQGTIVADVPGQTLTISPLGGTFANQGMLEAPGGTLDVNNLTGNVGDAAASGGGGLDLDGTYTNDQTLSVTNATLTLQGGWVNTGTLETTDSTVNLGGNFTLADMEVFSRVGGTVSLTGTLDNRGTNLVLDAVTGGWILNGGTIVGGMVATMDGAVLEVTSNINNRLDGVTLDGDLNLLASSARVRIANGLTLNGTIALSVSGATIGIEGAQTIGGTGSIVFDGVSNGSKSYRGVFGCGPNVNNRPGHYDPGRQGHHR